MTRIVIEHKGPGSKLYAFVDGRVVGPVGARHFLEFDVASGDHLLNVGFGDKRPTGVAVPFHAAEGETKQIKTKLTERALLAARWHVFFGIAGLMMFAFLSLDFLLGLFGYELVLGRGSSADDWRFLAYILVPMGAVIYPAVEIIHRKYPKNFVKIEVLE